MQSKLEKLNEHRVALEIEAEITEVEQALDEAYSRVVKKVSVPGFRKGKTPRDILEKRYGKGVLVEEALDLLVPRTYHQALDEHKLEPIDHPEMEIIQPFEEGKPFIYKATVDVLPEVTLGDYASIRVPVQTEPVTEEEIVTQLKSLQQRHATLEAVEKEALENGDFATIDFEGYLDDQPFQGGAGQGYLLEIGSGTFIPGFEEGMIGMRPGERRDVKVTFPAEYRAAHLADQDAVFKVDLQEIKQKRLPEIDDELARAAGAESLEELKADIRSRLEAANEQKARNTQREEVVEQVVAAAEVIIPDVLVEREAGHALEEMKSGLEGRGLSFGQYLEASGKTEDEVRDELRPEAAKTVKTDLVLKAVAGRENVLITPEELQQEVETLAGIYQQDGKKLYRRLEKEGRLGSLRERLIRHKTIQLLADRAAEAVVPKEE